MIPHVSYWLIDAIRQLKSKKRRDMESNSVLLKHIYAKPFMKYDKLVLSSVKDQFFVLYGELIILKHKVHNLLSFFLNRAENWKTLIQHVAPKVYARANI